MSNSKIVLIFISWLIAVKCQLHTCNNVTQTPDTYLICKIFENFDKSTAGEPGIINWDISSANYCGYNGDGLAISCSGNTITSFVMSNDIDVRGSFNTIDNNWPNGLIELRFINVYPNGEFNFKSLKGLNKLEILDLRGEAPPVIDNVIRNYYMWLNIDWNIIMNDLTSLREIYLNYRPYKTNFTELTRIPDNIVTFQWLGNQVSSWYGDNRFNPDHPGPPNGVFPFNALSNSNISQFWFTDLHGISGYIDLDVIATMNNLDDLRIDEFGVNVNNRKVNGNMNTNTNLASNLRDINLVCWRCCLYINITIILHNILYIRNILILQAMSIGIYSEIVKI